MVSSFFEKLGAINSPDPHSRWMYQKRFGIINSSDCALSGCSHGGPLYNGPQLSKKQSAGDIITSSRRILPRQRCDPSRTTL